MSCHCPLARYLETVKETVRIGTKDMEEIYKEQVEELRRRKTEEEARLAEELERFGRIQSENSQLKRREAAIDCDLKGRTTMREKLVAEK